MIFNIEQQTITVWKQERIIARANGFDTIKFYTNIEGSAADPIATYTTPSDGVLYIDVTDYVRVHPDVVRLYFYDETNEYEFETDVTVAGLINPAGVLIPDHDGEAELLVVPPSCMYYAPTFPPAIIETRPRAGVNLEIAEDLENGLLVVNPLSVPSQTLQNLTISFGIQLDQNNIIVSRILRETNCECRYACVEWVSFTGATRRHVFEIVKATVETGDTVELANILNEWTEIKGRVDGFTLRLENLDRYDLWYYSDLITSSSVRVTIDGATWYNVQVDERAYTLPESNAGKLSTLEIPVKFRKYDAVSL